MLGLEISAAVSPASGVSNRAANSVMIRFIVMVCFLKSWPEFYFPRTDFDSFSVVPLILISNGNP